MKGTLSSPEEQKQGQELFQALFSDPAAMPVSFRYGDQQYRGLNGDFAVTVSEDSVIGRLPDGLEVIVTKTSDPEYAQCEWTLSFRNGGQRDSWVLSEVFSADLRFNGPDPELSWSIGDRNRDPWSFSRVDLPLRAGTRLTLSPVWGKPTGSQRPYYRLNYGDGGVILAIGWHGRWRAEFFADDPDQTVRFRASQFCFRAYLKPGETVVMPSVVMLRYSGRDRNHAMNCWRRWFHDRAFYRYNGEVMPPKKIVGGSLSVTKEINEQTFHALLDNLDKKLDTPYDLFWVDAGWYYKCGSESLEARPSYWNVTGTWRMDRSRFPTCMRSVSERLRKKNARMLLWFEPERVTAGTELYEEDALCLSVREDSKWKLADMGNPVFRQRMIATVEEIMKQSGAAIYRQDFNVDPYRYWQQADETEGENRQGITENRYIAGIMDYYREIHSRFPEYPIDMCASGGMRNDISVMKQSVMLTFTDNDWNNTVNMQNMRLGMFEWFSCFAGGTSRIGAYAAQSNFAPYFAIQPGVSYILDPDKPYDEINRQFAIWEQIKHLMYCDYYPLTERSAELSVWIAWQFYDTEYKAGFAQFFRREQSAEEERVFRLCGLEEEKQYRLRELNSGEERLASGKELLCEGLSVRIGEAPGCALWKLEEVD